MDIRTFVSNALEQVVMGVIDAKKTVEQETQYDLVNPHMSRETEIKGIDRQGFPAQLVQFDIAVQASETAKISADGKGSVVVISGKIDGSIEAKKEDVSRLKFSVPLSLPTALKD